MDTLTLTLHDIAESLRVHPVTVRRWVAAGEFPPPLPLPGRVKRWSRSQVMEYLRGAEDHRIEEALK